MISPNRFLSAFLFFCLVPSAFGAISITGVANRTRYTTSATFTVTGATSATLDGAPTTVGSAVAVISIGYHELSATDGVSTQVVAFIVRNSERSSTEDGIPTMVPYHFVNDAPSAFAAGELSLLAPSSFPLNLPLPVVGRLVKGSSFGAAAGEPLWLNGVVSLAGAPTTPLQLRRGWGSTIVSPATTPGSLALDATVNGRAAPKTVTIEASTTYTTKGGTVSTAENWGSNARIYLSTKLIVAAGGSVTVGAGTIVKCAQGVEIEIAPGGSMTVNGTTADPVVFVPENATQLWGGVWLQPKTGTPVAQFTATGTIFCRWGNNQTYLNTAPHNLASHRPMEPCFTLSSGGILSLTDCALVGPTGLSELRGSAFASAGGFLNLNRVLAHRCITGGEMVAGGVEISQSALLEMTEPGVDADSGGFADADNDGIYLVPGSGVTYHLTKTVVGWTKDDGIDTGGDGSGTTLATNCWFENCVHEAISNSGVGRVPQTVGGIHFNNGQAMECGYGGPISLVKDALLVGNMVGARFGDNYGGNSGSNGTGTSQYDGNITVQNSLSINNYFHDTWAIDFSRWTYSNERLTMTGSKVSKAGDLAAQNGIEDSGNSLWNPAADAALLAPFMPVPGSAVGVDLLLTKRQDALATYPSSVNVRLSTFSSNEVSVSWQAVGKTSAVATVENILASGTLTFAQGETLKTITPTLPVGHGYASIILRLVNPVNTEVTGLPAYYFQAATPPPDQVFFNKGATTWSYQALRAAPANDANGKTWKDNGYIETSWQQNKAAPIGFGQIGVTGNTSTLGTTLTTTEQGTNTDRTKTVYFRKTFTVSDPAVVSGLILDYFRDDGSVFYLNGTEILRENIDSGTSVGGVISYTTLAAASPSDADENLNHNYPVPSNFLALLVPGANVIAVEVHQSSITSSDLVLDAKLTATFGSPTNSPTAVTESYSTNQNTPFTVAAPGLLANDTDPDSGTTLTAHVDAAPSPSVGTVAIGANGSFTFTPAAAFTGAASFTYRAFDGLLVSDPVVVNITVVPVAANNPPVFANDPISLNAAEDAAFTGQLLASDVDAGAVLTFAKLSGPAWLIVSASGALSGTPTNSEVGLNTFGVQVSDGTASVSATLNLTVANANDAPVFAADPVNLTATGGAPFTGELTATDDDAGDVLSFTKQTGPSWLSVSPAGSLTGSPTNSDAGLNVFTVAVFDGTATVTATLNISVAASGPSLAAFNAEHFSPAEQADPLISGPSADPDGDGVANLLEYAFGTDPRAASSSRLPQPSIVPVSSDQFVGLTFVILKDASDLSYTPEFSSSPGSGFTASPFVQVSLVDNGDGTQTLTVRDSTPVSGGSTRFARLRVTQN